MAAKSKRRRRQKYPWDPNKVKALREHLGLTQQQLSETLGVRQQTISDWETGQYVPRGASVTLLNIVAERAAFTYSKKPAETSETDRR